MSHRAALAKLLTALLFAITLGCSSSRGAPAPSGSASAAAAASKQYPSSVEQADTLKSCGLSWTNEEIRVNYNEIATSIAASNEQWKRAGLPAEERARRAFDVRHTARLLSRAMMGNPQEVEDLRLRDREKYGNPDGPTFNQLVETGKQKGAVGDAVYEGIIASAQRTDEKVNAAFGLPKRTP